MVYHERYQAKYGYWRPIIQQSVTAYLKCGDLHEGFARVRCADCQHEMFVAFSCKLVLELNAAYSASSIGFPDQTDQPQELTYVDIATFLSTF